MKILVLLLLPAALLAQLTPNSATVTATRNTVVPADEIVFNVTVEAPADAPFEDVVAAASGAGITAADFRGVNASSAIPTPSWLFVKTAPIADQKSMVGLLSALQQSLAREKRFTLSFRVGGTQLSAAAQQKSETCPLADLVTEARTKAANLAAASGMTIGAVQSLSAETAGCSLTARYALGPAGPGTITITARDVTSSAAPNRIAVALTVSADVGVGLDQILQAAPAGVSVSDLLGAGQPYVSRVCIMAPCNPVDWDFRYTAPLSKWKETVAALAAAKEAKHPGITVGYGITAAPPPAPECALPTLVSQARRRAQDVATAAGVTLGALSAVSDGMPQSAVVPAVSFAVIYDPLSIPGYVARPSSCAAVAQFVMTP